LELMAQEDYRLLDDSSSDNSACFGARQVARAQSGATRRGTQIRAMLSEPETVCCIIEDSSPGISPMPLPNLFDRFFTTKDTGMGTGLRKLPISQSIIEAHGGYIRGDNNSDQGGARFTFALPAKGAGG
jgi:signal transduction histidine kinase